MATTTFILNLIFLLIPPFFRVGAQFPDLTMERGSLVNSAKDIQVATFAANCFWGPEARFGAEKGVLRTKVGYTGGSSPSPDYYSLGDHTESVQVQYDPTQISFNHLLDIFWSLHDPTQPRNRQYRSAIFYHNERQKLLALESLERKSHELEQRVLNAVEKASLFYDAEGFHQKYLLKQNRVLFREVSHLTSDDMKESSVAARLNGLAGGYGSLVLFSDELNSYNLSGPGKEHILKLLQDLKQ